MRETEREREFCEREYAKKYGGVAFQKARKREKVKPSSNVTVLVVTVKKKKFGCDFFLLELV